MTEHPRDAEAIFLAALYKATPQERAAYVEATCAGDLELLRRVRELLDCHDESQGPLDAPLAGRAGTVDLPAISEKPGTVIGPYKLLQQIGEGGMGTVFMAEQTQPVRRKVALKLIKPGMDSRQVIARFEAELQALALMDHPNIAKILDAGTTESGRPYFVMELVKGVPITRYCDEHHLTPRQRLELFVPVCQAVQHAHHKGIIHRDMKPSNVMVCIYDGKPVPKVIDFGVAKATGAKLTDQTVFTEFGAIVGTFEYMSPEQAELDQFDIDTRCDIYSLGVLLYELLTGTTPLERKRIKTVALLELLRLVREEEAPRPSTRLSATETLPSIAASRGTEPKKLSGLMRGELDWIVLKALEKDRNRRYETANAFAADVLHLGRMKVPAMAKLALFLVLLAAACIVAGVYGALHNQISYTVSPDYFFAFKFHQFAIPDDLRNRIGAAIVGWHASWWMGLIIGVPVLLIGLILSGWKSYLSHGLLAFAAVACTALFVGLGALVLWVFHDLGRSTAGLLVSTRGRGSHSIRACREHAQLQLFEWRHWYNLHFPMKT